jgi:uncharacterized small protein (TIGR04563 family)
VPAPKKKVTLYFSSGMLEETQKEAIRQDRSISWIIQAAWRIAREEVRRLPGVAGMPGPGHGGVPATPPVVVAEPLPLGARAKGRDGN